MVDVLIGIQWGDEGKGKIIDFLAPKYDVVARFNGGPNAGHSIIYNDKVYALHLIPSGIFYGKICVIGNGVVIDPVALKKEIEDLEVDGIRVRQNLLISSLAHIITPCCIYDDAQKEKTLKIGTTGKGIGPAYMRKAERSGVRVCDITTEYINGLKFEHIENDEQREKNANYIQALEFLMCLKIGSLETYLNNPDFNILAEGAQGTFLDIDFGTYPYVSSSHSTIGGVMTGLGISHRNINKVYGVFKAYMTRVGNGPFVTELKDEMGEKIRTLGNEYGSTTGRPRRCGWSDLPMLRYACMINGVTDLIMTKADVLNDFENVKLCLGYDIPNAFDNGEYGLMYDYVHMRYKDTTIPIYQDFFGWNTETNKLPLEAYIKFIEDETGVPITYVSHGRERNSIYMRK